MPVISVMYSGKKKKKQPGIIATVPPKKLNS